MQQPKFEISTCLVAVNGSDALKKLAVTIPDYIFLDINMPMMDGKETLARIRHDDRLQLVPVYILSTSNDIKEADLCLELGATKWIVKPSSFDDLVRGLKSVLKDRYVKTS